MRGTTRNGWSLVWALALTGAGAAHGSVARVGESRLLTAPASTWDGGGDDALWTTAANWVGDVAPLPGHRLVFPPGAARLESTNDFSAGTSFESLELTGEDYTLNGNAIALTAGISANVADSFVGAGPRVELDLSLGAAQSLVNSGAAPIELAGAVALGATLTVDAAAGNVALLGPVSGVGGLSKTGEEFLILAGENDFEGATVVSAGFLAVRSDTALGAASAGTFVGAAGGLYVARQEITVAEPITFFGGLLIGDYWGSKLTGEISLAATVQVLVPELAEFEIAGALSGPGGLTKEEKGPLTLSGSNSFEGDVALYAGTLVAASSTALGDPAAGTLVAGGTTLALAPSVSLAEPLTFQGGTLRAVAPGATLDGEVTVDSSFSVVVEETAELALAGSLDGDSTLVKEGKGRLSIRVDSSALTGGIVAAEGEVTVNGADGGSLAAAAATLESGAILDLSTAGTVGGLSSIGGTVSIGNHGNGSAASAGDVALDADSTFMAFLVDVDVPFYSRLAVTGTVDLGSAALDLELLYGPTDPTSWMILQNDGGDAVVGTFAGLPEGAALTAGAGTITISYLGGDGNDVELTWRSADLFADSFESGDVAAWSSSAGFVGDLLASDGGIPEGTFGLPRAVDGSLAAFGAVEIVALAADGAIVGRLLLVRAADGGTGARLLAPGERCDRAACATRRLPQPRPSELRLEWRAGASLLLFEGEALLEALDDRRREATPIARLLLREVQR